MRWLCPVRSVYLKIPHKVRHQIYPWQSRRMSAWFPDRRIPKRVCYSYSRWSVDRGQFWIHQPAITVERIYFRLFISKSFKNFFPDISVIAIGKHRQRAEDTEWWDCRILPVSGSIKKFECKFIVPFYSAAGLFIETYRSIRCLTRFFRIASATCHRRDYRSHEYHLNLHIYISFVRYISIDHISKLINRSTAIRMIILWGRISAKMLRFY